MPRKKAIRGRRGGLTPKEAKQPERPKESPESNSQKAGDDCIEQNVELNSSKANESSSDIEILSHEKDNAQNNVSLIDNLGPEQSQAASHANTSSQPETVTENRELVESAEERKCNEQTVDVEEHIKNVEEDTPGLKYEDLSETELEKNSEEDRSELGFSQVNDTPCAEESFPQSDACSHKHKSSNEVIAKQGTDKTGSISKVDDPEKTEYQTEAKDPKQICIDDEGLENISLQEDELLEAERSPVKQDKTGSLSKVDDPENTENQVETKDSKQICIADEGLENISLQEEPQEGELLEVERSLVNQDQTGSLSKVADSENTEPHVKAKDSKQICIDDEGLENISLQEESQEDELLEAERSLVSQDQTGCSLSKIADSENTEHHVKAKDSKQICIDDEGLENISLQEESQEDELLESERSLVSQDEEEVHYVDEDGDEEQQLLDVLKEGEMENNVQTEGKIVKADKDEDNSKFEEISDGSIDQAEQEEVMNDTFSDVEILGETGPDQNNKLDTRVHGKAGDESLQEVFFATENDDNKIIAEDKDNDDISDDSLTDHENANMSLEEISDDDVDISKKRKKTSEQMKNENDEPEQAPQATPKCDRGASQDKIAEKPVDERDEGTETGGKKRSPSREETAMECSTGKKQKLSPDCIATEDAEAPAFHTNICGPKKIEKSSVSNEHPNANTPGPKSSKPTGLTHHYSQTEPRDMKGKIVQCNINPIKPKPETVKVAVDDVFAESNVSSKFLQSYSQKLPPSIPITVVSRITNFEAQQDGWYSLALGPITYSDMDSVGLRNVLFKKADKFVIVFDENCHGIYKSAFNSHDKVGSFIREMKELELGNRYLTLSLTYGCKDTGGDPMILKATMNLMYEQDIQLAKQHQTKSDGKLRAKLLLSNVPKGVSKDFVHLLFPEALSVTSGSLFDGKRSVVLGFANTKTAQEITMCYDLVVINGHQTAIKAMDYVESLNSQNLTKEDSTIIIDNASDLSQEEGQVVADIKDQDRHTSSLTQTESISSSEKATLCAEAEIGTETSSKNTEHNKEEGLEQTEKTSEYEGQSKIISLQAAGNKAADNKEIVQSMKEDALMQVDLDSETPTEVTKETFSNERDSLTPIAALSAEKSDSVPESTGGSNVSAQEENLHEKRSMNSIDLTVDQPESTEEAVQKHTVDKEPISLKSTDEVAREDDSISANEAAGDAIASEERRATKDSKIGTDKDDVSMEQTIFEGIDANSGPGNKDDMPESQKADNNLAIAETQESEKNLPMTDQQDSEKGLAVTANQNPGKDLALTENQDPEKELALTENKLPEKDLSLTDNQDAEEKLSAAENQDLGKDINVAKSQDPGKESAVTESQAAAENQVPENDPAISKSLEDVSDEEMVQQDTEKDNVSTSKDAKGEDVLVLREDSSTTVLANIDLTLDGDSDGPDGDCTSSSKPQVTRDLEVGKDEEQKQEKLHMTDSGFEIDMEVIDVVDDEPEKEEKVLYPRKAALLQHPTSSAALMHTSAAKEAPRSSPQGRGYGNYSNRTPLIGREATFHRRDNYQGPRRRSRSPNNWFKDAQPLRQNYHPPMERPPYYPHRPTYADPGPSQRPGYDPRPPPAHIAHYPQTTRPPSWSYAPADGQSSRSGGRHYQVPYKESGRAGCETSWREGQDRRKREFQMPQSYQERRRASPPPPARRQRSRSRTLSDMSADSDNGRPPAKKSSRRGGAERGGHPTSSKRVSRSPISISSRSRSLSPVSRSPTPEKLVLKRDEIVKSVKQFLHAAKGIQRTRERRTSSISQSPPRPPQLSQSHSRQSPVGRSSSRQVHHSGERPSSSQRWRKSRSPAHHHQQSWSGRDSRSHRRSRSPTGRAQRASYRHRSPSPVSSESNKGSPPPYSSKKRDYHREPSPRYKAVSSRLDHGQKSSSSWSRRSRDRVRSPPPAAPPPSYTVEKEERSRQSTWQDQQRMNTEYYRHQQMGNMAAASSQTAVAPPASHAYYPYPSAQQPAPPPTMHHYPPTGYHYQPSPSPAHMSYSSSGPPYYQQQQQQPQQHANPSTYISPPSNSNTHLAEVYQHAFSIIQSAIGGSGGNTGHPQAHPPAAHSSHYPASTSDQQPVPATSSSKNKSWSMSSNALVFQRILGNEGKKK